MESLYKHLLFFSYKTYSEFRFLDSLNNNFLLISLELNEDASKNNIFPERSRTFSVSELLFCFSCFVCLFVCLYLHSCFFSYVRIDFNKHNASPTPPGGEISNSATLKMVRDMDQKKDMMQSNHEPSGIINDFGFQKLF